MPEASEADRYLIEQIARGDTVAWSQLVSRYHGRLLAFAAARVPSRADAEDLVQETLLLFLQSFKRFRQEASLETYLFTILRRRIIDHFRGRRVTTCAVTDSSDQNESGERPMADAEPSPSWYARRDEQTHIVEQAIAGGLDGMIRRLRDEQKLTDLRAIELLFHAQARNKDVARLCGLEERQVGLLKFRALEQIRGHLTAQLTAGQRQSLAQFNWEETEGADSILTRVWEQLRPTCPKRSTLGRMLLGTLQPPWSEYVEFHVNQLGCAFCNANLTDLRRESTATPTQMRDRLFQSTVGFLSRAGIPDRG
jgi:RNA polymerase sigma factor (sigma-70 family)